jgi:hypothetical protein
MPTPTPSSAATSEPDPLTPYGLFREALCLWGVAYSAWFDVAAALSCASLDLCCTAASARLAAAGLEQPLLNDP